MTLNKSHQTNKFIQFMAIEFSCAIFIHFKKYLGVSPKLHDHLERLTYDTKPLLALGNIH
jgi:hypothetical protein